jgi:hypothetical protein
MDSCAIFSATAVCNTIRKIHRASPFARKTSLGADRHGLAWPKSPPFPFVSFNFPDNASSISPWVGSTKKLTDLTRFVVSDLSTPPASASPSLPRSRFDPRTGRETGPTGSSMSMLSKSPSVCSIPASVELSDSIDQRLTHESSPPVTTTEFWRVPWYSVVSTAFRLTHKLDFSHLFVPEYAAHDVSVRATEQTLQLPRLCAF